MEELPKDPFILFSYINMTFRDDYASLDELCQKEDIDKDEVVKRLRAAGFEYNEQQNKFW